MIPQAWSLTKELNAQVNKEEEVNCLQLVSHSRHPVNAQGRHRRCSHLVKEEAEFGVGLLGRIQLPSDHAVHVRIKFLYTCGEAQTIDHISWSR